MDWAELISVERSAAMAPPGSDVSIRRDLLLDALAELRQQRALLTRLGADLRTVVTEPGS
jgi:hypothetical protein